MGFKLYATEGTAAALARVGLPVTAVSKVSQPGLNALELITSGEIGLIINTPLGQQARTDQAELLAAAVRHNVPLTTTLSAGQAAVNGIRALREKELTVRSLQSHYRGGRVESGE